MFRNWSYKQKNTSLLFGIICFSILIYFLAIQKTVRLYKDHKFLNEQTNYAKAAPIKIKQYEETLASLESKAGNILNMPELEQYELLDLVSSFCKNKGILLKEFPLATIHKRGGYNLESSKIIVEGSYTQIVELVYELERKIRAGKIASLHFTKKIDRKSRLHYLNAVIHLQQVKTTNDESL